MTSYYLGCDASKGYCDFVILNQQKEVVEANFQLDDTYAGHQSLFKVLEGFFTRYPDCRLYAGLESTGGYESNWYQALLNLTNTNTNTNTFNIKVTRLNPVGINHYKKAELERNNTDKISARTIACYLIDHGQNKKIIYNREDSTATLRKAWNFIRMLTKQCVQLLNQFESALYTIHPHLLTYCKSDVPNWVLLVVMQYPSAANLARARAKTVAKIPYVSQEKADELVKNAKENIGIEQDEISQFRLQSLSQQILHLRQLIKKQVETMMRFCPFKEDVEILTSFKGIGEFSAVGLLLIIQHVERFNSVSNLSSYVGVHPVYKESGDGSWGFRMSKQGSKEARWILFNVAKSAIVSNDMIKQLYQGYLDKGKEKMAAIGIIMHKITRIVYGMLKHKQKYDPKVDEANREKFKHTENQKKNNARTDRDRRYQKLDEKAPISRRQQKKRNHQQESTDPGKQSQLIASTGEKPANDNPKTTSQHKDIRTLRHGT